MMRRVLQLLLLLKLPVTVPQKASLQGQLNVRTQRTTAQKNGGEGGGQDVLHREQTRQPLLWRDVRGYLHGEL